MSRSFARRVVLAFFDDEHDLLSATRAVREAGYEIRDAFTPYAVHGLDDAMGVRPSRLPWVCFVFGLLGAALKVWFEFWTTSVDWPIDVGGKPWNSWPAFVPITFEVMVLLAGLSTVAAFILAERMFPGRRAIMPDARVTNDRFVLVIGERDAAFEIRAARALLMEHGAIEIRENELEAAS